MNSPESTFQNEHHVLIKVKVTGDSEQCVVKKEDGTWKDNAVYPRTELEMAEDPEKSHVPLCWTIEDNVVLCSRDVKNVVVLPQSSKDTGKCNSQNTNVEHHLNEDGSMQHAKGLQGPSKQSPQGIDTKKCPVNENCKLVKDINHVPGLGYKCNICNKIFRFPSLVTTHQKAHTGEKPFSCSVCNKRFARKSDFVRHEWIHKRRSLFHCSVCGKGFNAPSRLQSHQKTHMESDKTNILNKKPNKLLNLYSCEECGKEFSYNWSLIRHQQVHTKKYNIECEKEMSYDCNTCGLTFTRHSYLLEHQKIHTGYVLHVCERCGKRFVSAASLARHHKTHTEEQPYSCESGEISIDVSSPLTDLDSPNSFILERTHTKQIVYCHSNHQDTADDTLIVHHQDSHNSETIHICPLCGNNFMDSVSLLKHQEIHITEQPYACAECGRRFTHKLSLDKHLKNHTISKCSLCGESFSDYVCFTKHQKTLCQSVAASVDDKYLHK